MKEELEKVKKLLKKYGQEHLLLKYDEMDEEDQRELLIQINEIDFDLMKELYEKATKPVDLETITVEPIEHVDKAKLTVSEREMYEKKGIEAIKYNKFAVVTMAGGQGTRLGHPGPKGTYIFDVEKNKSIFETLCETLKDAWRKYDTVIPWYLMTSRENNDATVKFFEDHNYFGYPQEAVHFFKQGELPMLDLKGKVLLEKNGFVKRAANGHGGTLQSMERAKVLEEMKDYGIEWVFINGVDNVLVKPVDPLLIGMSIHNKVLAAAKAIEKTDPKEKVGVLCRKNKKVGVVEYTEISE